MQTMISTPEQEACIEMYGMTLDELEKHSVIGELRKDQVLSLYEHTANVQEQEPTGTAFPTLTYEDGIISVLNWILGYSDFSEIEEFLDF